MKKIRNTFTESVAPQITLTLSPGETLTAIDPIDSRPKSISVGDRDKNNSDVPSKSTIKNITSSFKNGLNNIASGKGLITWRYKNTSESDVDLTLSPNYISHISDHTLDSGQTLICKNAGFFASTDEHIKITTARVPMSRGGSLNFIRSFFGSGHGLTMQAISIDEARPSKPILLRSNGSLKKITIAEGESQIINQDALFGFSYSNADQIKSNSNANGEKIMSRCGTSQNKIAHFFGGAGLSDIEITGPRDVYLESKAGTPRISKWIYATIPAAILIGSALKDTFFDDTYIHLQAGKLDAEFAFGVPKTEVISFDVNNFETIKYGIERKLTLTPGCTVEDLSITTNSFNRIVVSAPSMEECKKIHKEKAIPLEFTEADIEHISFSLPNDLEETQPSTEPE